MEFPFPTVHDEVHRDQRALSFLGGMPPEFYTDVVKFFELKQRKGAENALNNQVSLEKVLRETYPALKEYPEVIEMTKSVISIFVQDLESLGVSTSFVRSGARKFAITEARRRGIPKELAEKWGIFTDEYSGLPEHGRRNMIKLQKRVRKAEYPVSTSILTRSVINSFHSSPDMDVMIGTDRPSSEIKLETLLPKIFDAVLGVLTKEQKEQLQENYEKEKSGQSNMKGILGDIQFEVSVDQIPRTEKRHAKLVFTSLSKQESGETDNPVIFELDIGTLPQSASDSIAERRNATSSYSNEFIDLPIKSQDGQAMIDLTSLDSWLTDLKNPIFRNMTGKLEAVSDGEMALRSARILIHMIPLHDDLQALIRERFSAKALADYKEIFSDLARKYPFGSRPRELSDVSKLIREFLTMMNTDPYLTILWAIETGAIDFFFPRYWKRRIVDALFTDRMTYSSVNNPNDPKRQATHLPAWKRTRDNISENRKIFLSETKLSGLRVFYDAIMNTTDARSSILYPAEFDNLIKIISGTNLSIQPFEEEKEYRRFYNDTIKPAIERILKVKSVLKKKSEFLVNSGYNFEVNWIYINSEADIKTFLFFDDFKALFNEDEIQRTRQIIYFLLNFGILTEWDSDSVVDKRYIVTPRPVLKSIYSEKWNVNLDQDESEKARRIAIKNAYDALVNTNPTDKSKHKSEEKLLEEAMKFVDGIASIFYPTILALLRRPPLGYIISYYVFHLCRKFEVKAKDKQMLMDSFGIPKVPVTAPPQADFDRS